jgi:predicted transcriptional regulator
MIHEYIAMPGGKSTQKIRAASKALFGSGLRLEAAAFIAEHDEVYAREMAGEIEVAENEAGRELKHFAAAGLLDRPRRARAGGRRMIYKRRDSTFWGLAKQLLGEMTDQ